MNNKYSILVWGLIILGIIGIVFGMIAVVTKNSGNPGNALVRPVDSGDWISGPREAKAILVEYSDFQCSACQYYYFILKKLENDFPQQLQVVYRYFPLEQIHKYSKLSAQAAEASGKQGKFWEMHNLLFEKQNEWSVSPDAESNFIIYAQILNLDVNKFRSDLNSKETEDRIQKDVLSAYEMKLAGTPAFFLNGKQILNPRDYEEFKGIVQKEIGK